MSAGGYLDACGFIPVSSGTGNFVVSAAVTGYQTPASASAVNALVYSYRAESPDKSQWEEGFGAYTVGTTTLARTTITANSSGGTTAISFSAAPNVYITAASADLQNAALLTSGTLPVGRINGGTANQFVQGDGTFQTQGRKLLNTLTASNSATLSDITSLTASFTEYEIVFENVLPATNNTTLELQVHTGGSFPATSYLATHAVFTSATVLATSTTFIQISQAAFLQNSGSGFSGQIRVYVPSGVAAPKMWRGAGSHHNGTFIAICDFAGYWNGGNGAVDGFQLLMAAGNITSGVVKIYGLN